MKDIAGKMTLSRNISLELGRKEKQKVVAKKRGKGILVEDCPE